MKKTIAIVILFVFLSCCSIAYPVSASESTLSNIFNDIDVVPEQPVESLTVGQFVDIVELELSKMPARLPKGFYTEKELMELLKDISFQDQSKRRLCIERDVYVSRPDFPISSDFNSSGRFKRKKVCYDQPAY